jgi:outer membrane PBP1 activator LpoA protein
MLLAPFLLLGLSSYSSLSVAEPTNLALLLPLTGPLALEGQAVRDGFMGAYFTSEQADNDDHQSLEVYDTQSNSLGSLYQQAITAGASMIIGPLTKSDVSQLNQIPITKPTLALNFTPGGSTNDSLLQFALSPEDEARQVAAKAWQDGKSHALIIAPGSPWGQNIAQTFTKAWQEQGGTVAANITYTNQTQFELAIKTSLKINDTAIENSQHAPNAQSKTLHRQDVNMIFLVALPSTAREIVPLLKFEYAGDIPIYATSTVYSGKVNQSADKDLDGLKFCDIPLILDNSARMEQVRKHMYTLIPANQLAQIRLYAFGIDAYQLMNHYPQLATNDFSYPGMTGTLYVGKNGQILRHLQWAQFVNGKPKLLEG